MLCVNERKDELRVALVYTFIHELYLFALGRLVDYLLNTISGMVISAKAGMEENACRRMVEQTLSFLR